MKFYLTMAQKYANIRTFDAEGKGGAGGSSEDDAAAAAAAAKAQADADAAKAQADADAAEAAKVEAARKAAESETAEQTIARLNAEKADLLRETMKRKEEAKDAKKALESYKGIDPKRVQELIDRELAAEQAAAEAKGDFERVKQMMKEAADREKAEAETRIAEMGTQLTAAQKQIEELTVGNAFGMSSFIKESLVLSPAKTRTLYGAHFDVVDNRVVAYDKPKSEANRTMLVGSSGDALSFDEALAMIVSKDSDKDSVMRSKAKSGAGSSHDQGAADKDKKPKQDQIKGVARIAASLKDL